MRILLIEDNPGDVRMIREMFAETNGGTAELEWEETLASGLERLWDERFDVLILDLTLPDSQGLETLRRVRPLEQKVPVVVLTGLEDDETARKARESGAQEYLVKWNISADSLERAIRYAMGRHAADEDLRKSEEHYRRLVENAAEGILTMDLNLNITYASPSAERQTGFTAAKVVGRSCRDFITAESFDVISRMLADQITRQRETDVDPPVSVLIEVEQYRKDDSTFPAEVSAGFLRDNDGTPYGIMVVSRDITEWKEAQEALRTSEEHYRLLYDNAGEAIISHDSELILTDINRIGCELIGYSREELVGKNILELGILHPEDVENAANTIRRHFDGEGITEAEYTFIRKDGAERFVTVTNASIRDPDGNVQSITNICRDVTDERRVVEALRRTQLTVDHSVDLVLWVTPEGKIIYSNEEACRRQGYTREEMLSLSIFDINVDFATDPGIWETVCNRLCESGHLTAEFRHRTKGSEVFPVEATLNHVEFDGGWFFVANVHDITKRKETEESLQASEEKYHILFENMLEGFALCRMVYDDDGHPVDWVYLDTNKAFEPVTGLINVVGKYVTEVIPGIKETNPELLEVYGRVASTGKPEQFEVRIEPLSIDLSIKVFSPEKGLFVAVFENITDRRAAEEKLRVSEEHYRRLVENADEGILTTDLNLNITYVSPSTERQTGFTAAEAVGHNSRDFITAESFDVISKMLVDKLTRQRETDMDPPLPILIEVEQYRIDGSTFPAEISASFLRDKDGTPYGVLVISRDITEWMEAKEALRKSEEHYRLLFENAGEGIFSHDSELILTDINRLGCEAIGYSREELLGRDILELGILHLDETENAANALRRLFDGEDIVEAEFKLISKDGAERLFTFTGAAIRDTEGNLQSVTNICRDVTDERLVEENLRQTSLYLESLLDHANAPIIVWDSEFKVQGFNHAFEKLTGYKADEVINRQLDVLFTEETREESLGKIKRTLAGEYWESVEIPILRKDGEMRIALWNSANIYDEEGNTILATIAQGQDITERKTGEEEIKHLVSRLMEEGDRVRANIAADLHDEVGQSLNAIKLAFDIYSRKMGSAVDDEMGERIESIREMLLEAIEKVRNISVELVPVDLADFGLDSALGHYLESFARETGAACEFKTDGAPSRVGLQVETSLFRIAQEALANIRNHSRAGSVEISTSWSESLVSISISDDGEGFDMDRAFEESRAGKHFGLVGMRERARMLKGEFSVKSEPGEGTTVTVSVPLERD